jgi:uncharacterized membrane protein
MIASNAVKATVWFKNGDHPNDNCRLIHLSDGSAPFQSEGKVVRYYRHPVICGQSPCPSCHHLMHDHGFIDNGNSGLFFSGVVWEAGLW